MEILTLRPLSRGEIEGAKEGFVDALFRPELPVLRGSTMDRDGPLRLLLEGGYPPAVARPAAERRDAWFASYITTMLERDVRDLSNIESLTAMPRLMALLAARATSLVNFAELSRSSGLPQSTLKRYVALLQATFLVEFLPAWSRNLGKRATKSPKLLMNDTGLAASLLGLSISALPDLTGRLMENFVILEVLKQAGWSRTRPHAFYMRTTTGQDRAGRVVGIEAKASGAVSGKDFNGLRALAEAAGDKFVRGIVLHTGAEAAPFDPNLLAAPVESLRRCCRI